MFKFCCETPIDQPSVFIAEIDHKNPIQRRLNSNKNSRKQQKHLCSSKPTDQKAKLKFESRDPYNSNVTQPLAKSIILPNFNGGSRDCAIHTWNSVQKDVIAKQTFSQFNQRKYSSRLQQKYINLLESNNKYSELAQSQYQPKEKKQNKITAELLELKKRLKNIDFSVISKLSGASSATERQKSSQVSTLKNI